MSMIVKAKDYLQKHGVPKGVAKLGLFVVTTLLTSTLLSNVVSDLLSPSVYRRGEVAQYTIRAPREFLLENTLETEKQRADAMAEVKRVFSFNDTALSQVPAALEPLFAAIQKLLDGSDPKRAPVGSPAWKQKTHQARVEIEKQFGVDFVDGEWAMIVDPSTWPAIQQGVVGELEPILARGVVQNKSAVNETLNARSGVLRNLSDRIEREIAGIDQWFSLEEARTSIFAPVLKSNAKLSDQTAIIKKLARASLLPNIQFDVEETQKRLEAARNQVKPTYSVIRRGEVLVRAGDIINPTQEWRLQQLSKELGSNDSVKTFFGYSLLTGLVLLIVSALTFSFWPRPKLNVKDLALVSGVLVGSLVLLKTFSILAATLGESFGYFDSETYLLSTPLAAGGILLQVTVGASGMFMFMLSFALLTGLFLKNSWIVLLLIVLGNSVGAMAVRKCSRRSSVIAAGARVALVNAALVCSFVLLYSDYSLAENTGRIFWALVGGMLSGVLGGGLTPIAEFFGRYITDIKLLELASLDRPLLRELSLQAPGTWNHSMVIGQIAEAAAEAVGANGLLTRVGAYYHDIGKVTKPAYFVENQNGENRHDRLTPSMSALIIKAHVKDGIELAREHRLPEAIIDFIPQHHGTSLISYFYTKAVRDADKDDVVEEAHYRYHGPKPQSREAGILMLADQVEASSRTLSDPTPARIQGLVQKIINRVFATGELDQCDLTLRDLHKIAKTFTRVLSGIYHRRIEYSEPADKQREPRAVNGSNAGVAPVKRGEIIDVRRALDRANGDELTKYESRVIDSGTADRGLGEKGQEEVGPGISEETLKRLGMQ